MGRLIPKVDGFLNCQLPGELIRSVIKQVVSDNLCIVQLSVATPMSKSHTYKRDDLVPVRRMIGDFGEEVWKAISDYEMEVAHREEEDREAAETAERIKRQEAEAAAELARRPVTHAFAISKAGDY